MLTVWTDTSQVVGVGLGRYNAGSEVLPGLWSVPWRRGGKAVDSFPRLVSDLRKRIRKARELVAAARMVGDSEMQADLEKELGGFQAELARALVDQVKEKKRGVSAKDVPAGKPAKLP